MSGDGQRLLLMFNAHFEPLDFLLPRAERGWTVLIDTEAGWAGPGGEVLPGDRRAVGARALVLLEGAS
jgi:hypothetical protein